MTREYSDRALRQDPKLFEPVKVRVLKSFWVGGKAVQPGEIIMLAKHDAESMRALRRVEAA